MNQWIRKAALMIVLPAAIACGGENNGPSGGGNSTMSASIAGTNWTGSLTVQGSYNSNVLAIAGNGGSGANNYQINITVTNVTAAGTFNFGAGAFGNQILLTQVGNPVSTWGVTGLGGTGTLTVTSISATGAQGTFSFTGAATPGTAATGTKAVTNGQFNVKF